MCAPWDSDPDVGWWKGAFLGGLGETFPDRFWQTPEKGPEFLQQRLSLQGWLPG